MRTTVVLDDDVAAAVDQLRRQGMGMSAAVNELARRGLARADLPLRFEQRTSSMRARVDLSNVAEILDLLGDQTDH